ncbi:hypothetical protein [Gracilibacillus saliphilus]|uniref:hypothetical protein n=1 Tax=Gracilibacillus saliphilus TaxID=543890 RepID=UPI0013D38043|nr:hypothetical protein [Gracilibacillus saliphilus]
MEQIWQYLTEKELRAIDVIVISVISTVLATIVIGSSKVIFNHAKNLFCKIRSAYENYYRKHIKHEMSLNELILALEKEVNGEKLTKYERKGLDKYNSKDSTFDDVSSQDRLNFLKKKKKYLGKKSEKSYNVRK